MVARSDRYVERVVQDGLFAIILFFIFAFTGLVSQDPVLFNASIRENLLYGCPTASQREIEEACRRANAHDFICDFPEKYDTVVGEGGSQLISVGQKQRIG